MLSTAVAPPAQALAGSFAQDNMNHVAFWRNQLGAAANPMPQVRSTDVHLS